jgi:hypothetical protein
MESLSVQQELALPVRSHRGWLLTDKASFREECDKMEWLECASKLVQSCLNQARKASERLECPSQLIKRCLNQARKALER